MNDIDAAVWLHLFAPALFAFIVGGGFWAFAQATTSSLSEAGEKFKLYTWFLFPAASFAYALYIALAMPPTMREALLSGIAPQPQSLFLGFGVGFLIAAAGHIGQQQVYKSMAPQDRSAFATPEWRELPGLVLIAPVAEELVFRGYGLFALEGRPIILAALITSVAFALIHVKPWLIAFSFFAGLALFFLFSATGDLLTAIIAHATANGAIWLAMRRARAGAGAKTGAL